jgi:hypothetical protein
VDGRSRSIEDANLRRALAILTPPSPFRLRSAAAI